MKPTATNTPGILLMCMAMGMFVINDTIVKLVSASFTIAQIMTLRGVFVCLFSFIWVVGAGYGRAFSYLYKPRVLLRSGLEGLTTLTYFIALSKLPIANLTAIFLSTPLIIIAAAALFMHERMALKGWCAVMLGFAGVLLIVKPGMEGFTSYALLGLLAAFFAASRDLITRKLDTAIPSLIVCLGSGLANMFLGLACALFQFTTQPLAYSELMSWQLWLLFLIAAIVVTLGNYGVILACRISKLSAVSPFRYSSLIWAMLAGLVIWRQAPDMVALAGSLLVIGSGLYLLQRERAGRAALRPATVDA